MERLSPFPLPPLVTRGARDYQLELNPSSILGCTSVSLSYIQEALIHGHLPLYRACDEMPSQAHIYLIPTESVFYACDFASVTAPLVYQDSSRRLFTDNQEYGAIWAVTELLLQSGLNPHQVQKHYENLISALLRVIESTGDLNSHNPFAKVDTQFAYPTKNIARHLATLGIKSDQFFFDLRHRGGVQILYRDSSSMRALLRNQVRTVLDDVTLEVNQPIPLAEIYGLVALGDYEYQALKSRSNQPKSPPASF
jgi:hypothetical protein